MSTHHSSPSPARSERAWPRFWARQFDYAICWGIAAGTAGLLGMASPVRLPNLLIAIAIGAMLVGVLHLVYEALMLTVFGTTIGKSVFGLRVQRGTAGKRNFPAFSAATSVHGSGARTLTFYFRWQPSLHGKNRTTSSASTGGPTGISSRKPE
jgi:hypothetical protein